MTEFETNLNHFVRIEDLDTNDGMNLFLQSLLIHGWCEIHYNKASSSFSSLIYDWERIFSNAFSLNDDFKINAGKYRIEDNVAVGYRRDESREFMETRLLSKNADSSSSGSSSSGSSSSGSNDWMNLSCSPSFPQIEKYDDTVINMVRFLSNIVAKCLKGISKEMGLDEDFLLDLTDIPTGIEINQQQKKLEEQKPMLKQREVPSLSSTLLRICRYPSGKHSAATEPGEDDIAFGSHTDTSLLTIAPHSTIPGLEIRDNLTKEWVMPEKGSKSEKYKNDFSIIIFTGEMLQCLSRHKYKATVHRVRAPIINDTCRISCPLIVRANGKATFNPLNDRYTHTSVENLPDLDGVKMTFIQKILDMKRAKRVKQHTDTDNHVDWILKAYDSDTE